MELAQDDGLGAGDVAGVRQRLDHDALGFGETDTDALKGGHPANRIIQAFADGQCRGLQILPERRAHIEHRLDRSGQYVVADFGEGEQDVLGTDNGFVAIPRHRLHRAGQRRQLIGRHPGGTAGRSERRLKLGEDFLLLDSVP